MKERDALPAAPQFVGPGQAGQTHLANALDHRGNDGLAVRMVDATIREHNGPEAPLPGRAFDTVVAIEVFLHHPPAFVVQLCARLAAVVSHIVSIDWSEDWTGPLPEHVWVHDYARLFAQAGLACATFVLPERIDGKHQKLFVAARELPEKLLEIYFQNPQFGYYFLVLTSRRLLENIARLEAIIAQEKAAEQAVAADDVA